MENEEEILLKRREIERMSNKQHQKSFIWKSLFRTWAYSHISNEKKWKKKIFSIYTKPCHVNHIRFLMLSIPLSNIYVGIYHLNWRKFCLFQEFMCFFYHLFLFIRSCLGYIFFSVFLLDDIVRKNVQCSFELFVFSFYFCVQKSMVLST